jgi:hypothetical protein
VDDAVRVGDQIGVGKELGQVALALDGARAGRRGIVGAAALRTVGVPNRGDATIVVSRLLGAGSSPARAIRRAICLPAR